MLRPIPRAALAASLGLALLAPAGSAAAAPTTTPPAPIGGARMGLAPANYLRGPGTKPLPAVHAASWVLADATTGEVLAAKSPHLRRPPASTLKALTALTVLPEADLTSTYTAVAKDTMADGSRVGLVTGGTYTLDQLFTALFLPSANDAAVAIARSQGPVKATVANMNAEAKRLHAMDTVAKNPSGLDAPGQLSSAYDLALIGRAGLANADFRHYCSLKRAAFPGKMPTKPGAKRATYMIYNQNRMLLHGYKGALGVKTGYTHEAGRTFIGAAQRGNRTLIVTLMGVTDPTENAAEALLSWGFKNASKVQPIGRLVEADAKVDDEVVATDAPGPVQAARSAGMPSAVRYGVLAVLLLAGVGIAAVAFVGNGGMNRRRIRRRYR